jgi:hypothetical protein
MLQARFYFATRLNRPPRTPSRSAGETPPLAQKAFGSKTVDGCANLAKMYSLPAKMGNAG